MLHGSKQQQLEHSIELLNDQLQSANNKITQLQSNSNKISVSDEFNSTMTAIELSVNEMVASSKAHTNTCEQLAAAINQLQLKLNAPQENLTQSQQQNNVINSPSPLNGNVEHIPAPDDLPVKSDSEHFKDHPASNFSQVKGTDVPQFKSNLRPPVQKVNATAQSTIRENVYDIYVSQFQPTTTSDDIANYITESTDFTKDDFEVILLANKRLMKFGIFSYVSFKISTSAVNVYDAILNEKLWAPEFKATPYKQKSSRESNQVDSIEMKQSQQKLLPPGKQQTTNKSNQSNKSGNSNTNVRRTAPPTANNRQHEIKQQQKRNSNSKSNSPRQNCSDNLQDFRFTRHNRSPHNQHHYQQSQTCCHSQSTPSSQQQQIGQPQIPTLQQLQQQWIQLQQIFGHQQSAPTMPVNNQWQQHNQQQEHHHQQFQRNN